MHIEPPRAKSSCYNDLLKEENISIGKMTLEELSDALNHKIRGLALAKIPNSNYGIICGHRVAAAPQVVFNILPKTFNFKVFEKKRKLEYFSKTLSVKQKKSPLEEYNLKNSKYIENSNLSIPIGIPSNPYNSWINALLQFVIFVPSLRMMFNYTPKSFSAFNDFIDIYLIDQEEKRVVTKATSSPVVETLARCFGDKAFIQSDVADIFGILEILMKYFCQFENVSDNDRGGGDLLALFPDWRISLENENIDLEEYVVKYLLGKSGEQSFLPAELLINFKWFLKKESRGKERCKASMLIYFFDSLFLSTHYELDRFIEFRDDEFSSPSYLTYVKIDGLWYQCDDARVRQVRPSNLHIALSRSFIFHYSKVKSSQESKKMV